MFPVRCCSVIGSAGDGMMTWLVFHWVTSADRGTSSLQVELHSDSTDITWETVSCHNIMGTIPTKWINPETSVNPRDIYLQTFDRHQRVQWYKALVISQTLMLGLNFSYNLIIFISGFISFSWIFALHVRNCTCPKYLPVWMWLLWGLRSFANTVVIPWWSWKYLLMGLIIFLWWLALALGVGV